MRPRSLSVAFEKPDIKFTRKFEGVSSDHEGSESDSDDDLEEVEGEKVDFSSADFDKLVEMLRKVLPKNDNKKAETRLKTIDWERVAFNNYSADTIKNETVKQLKSVRKFRTLDEMLGDLLVAAKKSIGDGKPKGPPSAYNIYMKENIADTRQAHPQLSMPEVFRIVADDFKKLPSTKKQKYEKKAEAAKLAFKEQLAKYYQTHPDELTNKKKGKRKTSNSLSKLSGQITPYNLFKKEKLLSGVDMNLDELKTLWENLAFEQKMKYIRQAYGNEKSKLTKNEKDMLATALGKPEIVPRTSCEYYIKRYAKRDPSMSIVNWRREAAYEFKKLSKFRKLELELEVHRERANFVAQYQRYIDILVPAEKQKEIQFLQAYIESTMDKEEKKKYNGAPVPDLTGCGGNTGHDDITDLPIAESTTHEMELGSKKKKSKKKSLENPPKSDDAPKPLKSILKSPAPVAAPPKRQRDDVQTPESSTSSKKKKMDKMIVIESESDSNTSKKTKKKAKKEKESDNGVNSSQGTIKNSLQEKSAMMSEPKRPPKDILKYYKKFHYFGRAGKHKESFEKLSDIKKKKIEVEMREAQKKYMEDLKKYLDHLPPSEVQSYVTKLKKFVSAVGSADEHDSDEEEQKSVRSVQNITKQELSDDDDDLSDE